jgi:quercetin dioxygenase-like cupin family protein
MTIIRHSEQPETRGYFSKVTNRRIITQAAGARSFEVWDQVLPPGGFITAHSHEFEESLTFLVGLAEVEVAGEVSRVGPDTTVFLSPGVVHSVRNIGKLPVRLLAVLLSPEPKLVYPSGSPPPVLWNESH